LKPFSNCSVREIPAHYGRPTARKLAALAKESGSSGRALAGRSVSLRILCDQLEHTRTNLARLDAEIESLLANDPGVKGLQQVPGCGRHFGGRPAC
jgi:transposase